MADTPKQDRLLGLPRERIPGGPGKPDRFVTAYDPGIALAIVEKVAEGELLKNICTIENGFPSKQTFLKWVSREPELAKAYQAAMAISALSFEEEAIDEARKSYKSPGTAQAVSAAGKLIDQLRWSAARRNPQHYGDKSQTQVVVPVHISTSLNLGEGSTQQVVEEIPDIYTLSIEAPAVEDDAKPLLPDRRQIGPRKTVLTPRVPMDADLHTLQQEGKLKRATWNPTRERRQAEKVKEGKADG